MLIMKTCSLFYRTATIYCSIITSLRLNVGNYQKKLCWSGKEARHLVWSFKGDVILLKIQPFTRLNNVKSANMIILSLDWRFKGDNSLLLVYLCKQMSPENGTTTLRASQKKIPKRLASQWSSSWTANKSPALGTMHEIYYYRVKNLNFCMTC